VSKHVILALLGITAVAVTACDDGTTSTGTSDTDTGEPDLAGNVVVDPCSIDFGVLEAGDTASQFVNVNNTGLGILNVVEVTTSAPFSTSAQSDIDVEPEGGRYQFNVNFEPGPDDYGLSTGELVVTTDDPDEPSIVCTLQGSVTDDADLDGFTAVAAGGSDCDDNDPDINPGAVEVWYDGVDSDCAGDSDFDQDGDGYEAAVYYPDSTAVRPESGLPGGDCQDVFDFINPGEEEVWYDGTDADCDGQNDFDKDGDGYRTAEFGYRDCNDDDPLANPEAVEAFNGADDDCNGLIDDKASPDRANAAAYGYDDDYAIGRGVAMDKIDSNDLVDIAIGCHYMDYSTTGATTGDAPGAVAIYWDNDMADDDFICDPDGLGDESLLIEGATAEDELGYEVITVPDFNGDGNADLVATARGADNFAGTVYVFDGATMGSSTTIDSAIVTVSGLTDYQLGSGLGTGDINGDGLSDLIMYGGDRTDLYTYTALQYGSDTGLGDYGWTDVDASWLDKCGRDPRSTSYLRTCGKEVTIWVGGDEGARDSFDNNGHAPADFDGDGYDDFLVGDGWSDDGGTENGGTAWVLFGRRSEHTAANADYSDAMTTLAEGVVREAYVGGALGFMPDIDGDGADEVLVHDDDRSTLYLLAGGTYLRAGDVDLEADSAAIFRGVSAFSGMTNAGDWSGDGVDDVVLSFGDGGTGGSVYMLTSEEWSGEYDFEEQAAGSIIGGEFNSNFGLGAPIYTADLDDNGTSDLLIGDYMYDDSGTTGKGAEGAVFRFYNSNL